MKASQGTKLVLICMDLFKEMRHPLITSLYSEKIIYFPLPFKGGWHVMALIRL